MESLDARAVLPHKCGHGRSDGFLSGRCSGLVTACTVPASEHLHFEPPSWFSLPTLATVDGSRAVRCDAGGKDIGTVELGLI
ncbi:hypothetical protein CGRA01v4_08894 [Colletotrichum graminicola]|nr:hypothetical protein CGRA01v4_08894 [Colletotrichum graminicola]